MELKQTLSENEILLLIGQTEIKLHLAHQNLQLLLKENMNLKNRIQELEEREK